MANLLEKVNYSIMSMPKAMNRTNPTPLDASAVWTNLEELQAYAATSAIAYVGQVVTYVDIENQTATVYSIADEAGTLVPVGSGVQGVDGATIELDDEGSLSLRDFGHKYYRYVPATVDEESGVEISAATYALQEVDDEHPWKSGLIPQVVVDPEDSTKFAIGWYEPNPTTIEGLGTAVSALQDEVNGVKTNLAENYYTKEQANAQFAGALHYKGLLESAEELPATGAVNGDLYLVQDGTEYVWNGTKWEVLGNQLDLSDLETKVGALETSVGSLDTTVGGLVTNVNTLNADLNTAGTGLKAVVSTLSSDMQTAKTDIGNLQTSVGNLEKALGAPVNGDTPASGVYQYIDSSIATAIEDLGAITNVTINGSQATVVDGVLELHDFTANSGLAGLVPVPSAEILASGDTYVLAADGTWVIPNDPRIGTLTYNDEIYNNVTEYVDARVNNVTITWSAITE